MKLVLVKTGNGEQPREKHNPLTPPFLRGINSNSSKEKIRRDNTTLQRTPSSPKCCRDNPSCAFSKHSTRPPRCAHPCIQKHQANTEPAVQYRSLCICQLPISIEWLRFYNPAFLAPSYPIQIPIVE